MIKDILISVIAEVRQSVMKSDKQGWETGTYSEMRKLQADKRGDVGELAVVRLLKQIGIKEVKHTSRTDPENKHWDIIADDITIEVKTATLGLSNRTFQHENLEKDRRCDMILFFDIAPNDVYITCWPKHSIKWNNLHNRRTGISYKCDFSLARVKENKIENISDFSKTFNEAAKTVKNYKSQKRKSRDI